jgi:hypothetical protein
VLYVNNEYYGIYALSEKTNEQHYANLQGVDKDCVQVLDYEVPRNSSLYKDVFEYCYHHDMREAENYPHFCELMDVDSLIESFYGMKVDEFIENELTPSAENALAQEIILTAISEKEGITMDDEELDERLAERAEAEGVSVETFTGGLDRETVRSYLLQDKVMDWLYQNVRIEDIEETESYYTFGNETEAETESVFGNETEAETESVSVNETEAETESVSVNETEAETESVSANETEAETESDMADETEKA